MATPRKLKPTYDEAPEPAAEPVSEPRRLREYDDEIAATLNWRCRMCESQALRFYKNESIAECLSCSHSMPMRIPRAAFINESGVLEWREII